MLRIEDGVLFMHLELDGIDKESFMENVDWMNLFKIRGTFGKTGNGLDNTDYIHISKLSHLMWLQGIL